MNRGYCCISCQIVETLETQKSVTQAKDYTDIYTDFDFEIRKNIASYYITGALQACVTLAEKVQATTHFLSKLLTGLNMFALNFTLLLKRSFI